MSTAVAQRGTPSLRVREKRQRRRAEILRAALGAFRDLGYHQTTLGDIAARLGVRKTALYHYFRDKEAILYACHRESCEEVGSLLAEAGRRHVTASGQLAWIIREHVRVMTDTLQGSPLAFEVTSLSPAHQAGIIAARDAYERGLRALIMRGIAEGEFRAVVPKTATFAILGAINWIARWYRPGGSLNAVELGDEFAAHLVGGLARR